MSSNINISGSVQIGTVNTRVVGWIDRILRDAGMPAPESMQLAIENNTEFELRLLNLKQLKQISSQLSLRTLRFHNNNLSSPIQNVIFLPPKSGARKAEWISAISLYFLTKPGDVDANNNIYNILNGESSLTNASARTSPKKLSPRVGAKTSMAVRKSPSKLAHAKKLSPAKNIRRSPVKKYPSNAKASMMAKRSSAKVKSTTASSANVAIAADEAIARCLQERYMEEDNVNYNIYQPWGGPLTNSYLENAGNASTADYGNANGRDSAAAGLKRPENYNINSTKPKYLPAKVKKEPLSHGATSCAASNENACAASSLVSISEDSLQPRGFRESNMVGILREMGFMNTQEILTALRAVAERREEVSLASNPHGIGGGNAWSSNEQVEAAMMWIVSQREEVAEAQKLDDARISSEQADAAMEQSRKQEMERELKNADLVDLLGSADGDVQIRSKHFPCSVLLRNRSVIRVLNIISSSQTTGKEQTIRLLNLEKKARKWYGTVLPFSYFEYVLCPRFEGWIGEQVITPSATSIFQRICNESDYLERAMFNLSEQQEGGVGSVPKVFLAAQRNATEKGLPNSAIDDRIRNDDDMEVIQLPPSTSLGSVGNSLSSLRGSCYQSKVIDID